MKFNFKGRDFLTLMDFTRDEVEFIVDTAIVFKRRWATREPHEYLRGRTIGCYLNLRTILNTNKW